MKYQSEYIPAKLREFNEREVSDLFQDALSNTDKRSRVLSWAAYDALEKMITKWLRQKEVITCRFRTDDWHLQVFLETPAVKHYSNSVAAIYSVPLADLVLSAVAHLDERDGVTRADVASMLRQMADKIK